MPNKTKFTSVNQQSMKSIYALWFMGLGISTPLTIIYFFEMNCLLIFSWMMTIVCLILISKAAPAVRLSVSGTDIVISHGFLLFWKTILPIAELERVELMQESITKYIKNIGTFHFSNNRPGFLLFPGSQKDNCLHLEFKKVTVICSCPEGFPQMIKLEQFKNPDTQ